MLSLTGAQWFLVVAYSMLVVFWLSVFVATLVALLLRIPLAASRVYRNAHLAFLVVSGVLALDSTYWAIANISRVKIIDPRVEALLRQPLAVGTVKTMVLLSSVVFLWIVVRLGKDIRSRMESIYFHGLIDQTWDAIGILDRNGVMVIWNSGAEKLFGFSREYAQGKHINKFLVPDSEDLREATRLFLNKAKIEKRAVRYRQPRLTKAGELILVDIVSSPIFDDDGKFAGYFGIMRQAVGSDASLSVSTEAPEA